MIPRSGLLLLVAACVLGCGSRSAPKYLSTVPALPKNATPTQIVQRAYLLLGHSSYRESVQTGVVFDTSGLPAAEAARVQAAAGQGVGKESAVAAITDFRNFQMTLHTSGRTLYLRASGGNYTSSADGVAYQSVPASTVTELLNVMQVGVRTTGGQVTSAKDLGPGRVGGVRVEEYVAVLPPLAVGQAMTALRPLFSQFPPSAFSYGAEHERVDLVPGTDAPVRIESVGTISLNLGSLHRAGVAGVLRIVGRSTRTFTQFRER